MNAFDCARCGHPINTHTVKQPFPHFTRLCLDCPCTGYQPIYKAGKAL